VGFSVYLAWLAGAGYLPDALSNPAAYLGVAAFGMALLVGMGLADLLRGVSEAAFGQRQLAAGILAMVVAAGLAAQAAQAAGGSWTVGGSDRVEPAYGLAQQPPLDYRVLWLGAARGDAFPAPGGLPDGIVAAGPASVRYGVRGPDGASALDVGRAASGRGYVELERALTRLLAGDTRHGGALLAPFGIRFVLARTGDLPTPVYRRLVRQIDLDQIPTQGLVVFRDGKAAPLAGVVEGPEWRGAAVAADVLSIEMLPGPRGSRLTPTSDQAFSGTGAPEGSLVYLGQQFDARWKLTPEEGQPVRPVRAFGWAVGFPEGTSTGGFRVGFGGQASRTMEMGLLAALWAVALWLTRRPVRSG
jgi:hypothetical protein